MWAMEPLHAALLHRALQLLSLQLLSLQPLGLRPAVHHVPVGNLRSGTDRERRRRNGGRCGVCNGPWWRLRAAAARAVSRANRAGGAKGGGGRRGEAVGLQAQGKARAGAWEGGRP